MPNDLLAEPYSARVTHHGEGPIWLDGVGLAVLDMLEGDIVVIAADGVERSRHHVAPVVAAVRPRSTGGYVVGIERGFGLLDDDFVVREEVTCWEDSSIRMNDGATDPLGRFWCGSMAYDLRPGAGALWCWDADRGPRRVLTDVGCSNGLAWVSPTRALYVDSLTGRVDRLEFDEAGDLVGRSTFADLGEEGFPDGMAVDTDGGAWVAMYGSGRVIHLDPDGRRVAQVSLPVPQVTACCFGGSDHSQLFITTSRHETPDPGPLAGAVFVVDTGVCGVPCDPCAF